ncbi:tetratricopeptide repeat protein [Candidatus Dependentiae bacterium]|nr:tetratricopeptide repeat protein [Candidatus Dependentiae bacterium]
MVNKSSWNIASYIMIFLILFFSILSAEVFCADINKIKAKDFYEKSLLLYKKNQISEAIEQIIQAIQYDSFNNLYYYNLGTYYLKLKDYDSAIENFINSIKYNSNHQESYYNIGLCYVYKNDFVKAADYFSQAVAYNQYDIDAHINLGLAYKNLKQYDAAMIEYQKAIMINPDNTAAAVNLAVLHKIQGNLEKAIDLLNSVIAKDPNNTEALYNLGLLKNSQSKLKDNKEQQSSVQGQTAVNEKVDTVKHKSSITGKEVALPLSFKEGVIKKEPDQPPAVKPSQNSYGIENYGRQDYLNFKTELISEIKNEFRLFLQEFKQISKPDNQNFRLNTSESWNQPGFSEFDFGTDIEPINFNISDYTNTNIFEFPNSLENTGYTSSDLLNFSSEFTGSADIFDFQNMENNYGNNGAEFQFSDEGSNKYGVIDFSSMIYGSDFNINSSVNFQEKPEFNFDKIDVDEKIFDFQNVSENISGDFFINNKPVVSKQQEVFTELLNLDSEINNLDVNLNIQ